MATEVRQIRVRRDTLANWTGVVPSNGEPIGIIGPDGLVTIYKIGDGVTPADQLPALSKGDKGITGAKGDQGLPGTNGVATDDAVATNLATATKTRAAALATAVDAAIAPTDPGYDLVLLLGQSNMAGRGTPYDAVRFDPSSPRIEQYGSTGTYAGIMSIAVEPLAMHDTPSGIGPGLAFARWYVQTIPAARRVLLVPAAHGGTRLSTDASPLGWRRGVAGNLYAQALSQALAARAAAGANARFVAAIWVQGESDGDSNTTGATYQTDLDALIVGLRSDLGVPDLPFVIGQMVPDYLTTGTRDQINAVHRDTPSRLPKTAFALGAAGQNMNDGNHYNAVGQRLNGRSQFDAWLRIRTGQADPAYPSLPGQATGVSGTPSGTTAAVTWNAVSTATAYLVEYRVTGASSWTRGGNTSKTTYTLQSLLPNTTYEVRVTALNSAGAGSPSATASFTTPDVPAVTDSFARADNTTTMGTTDTGQTWAGDNSVWGIKNNSAYMVSGSNGRRTVETGRSNGSVQGKFAVLSTANNHSRLLFRGDGGTNYWMVQLRVASGVGGKYQLYKSVSGTLTQVGSDSTASGAAGDVVKVLLSGDTITVQVNGTTVLTATDSFNNTATQHGFGSVGNDSTYQAFSAGP